MKIEPFSLFIVVYLNLNHKVIAYVKKRVNMKILL